MKVWLLRASEMMPIVDENDRLLRMGMLGKELSKRGHDVTWFGSTFNHYKKTQASEKDIVIEVDDNYRLNLIYAPSYKKNISIKRIINHKIIAIKLKKKIKKIEKPDIIFASYPTIEFAEVIVKYGKKKGIPVVIDVRDLWPDTFYHNLSRVVRILSIPYVNYLNVKAKNIMKNCYAITSISEQMLKWGLDKGGRNKTENDKTFYIGYEKENIISSNKNNVDVHIDINKFNICFFATINHQFNYKLITEVAKKIQNKNVRFLICGLGPKLEEFKNMTKGLKNIEFLGWQNKDNMQYILSNSKMGLAPYNDTFDFQMSVSNKYSEYLSYGLPIIITSSGYMKEITQQYKVGISSSSTDEICDFILKMLKYKKEYNKYSKNAEKLYEEKFDANKIYCKLVDYLEKVEKEYRK